jgi:hypothetical protein
MPEEEKVPGYLKDAGRWIRKSGERNRGATERKSETRFYRGDKKVYGRQLKWLKINHKIRFPEK